MVFVKCVMFVCNMYLFTITPIPLFAPNAYADFINVRVVVHLCQHAS